MPFLLLALDPSAVNQTHQAPLAMHTASVVFKPLLFPRPVVLRCHFSSFPSLLHPSIHFLTVDLFAIVSSLCAGTCRTC